MGLPVSRPRKTSPGKPRLILPVRSLTGIMAPSGRRQYRLSIWFLLLILAVCVAADILTRLLL